MGILQDIINTLSLPEFYFAVFQKRHSGAP